MLRDRYIACLFWPGHTGQWSQKALSDWKSKWIAMIEIHCTGLARRLIGILNELLLLGLSYSRASTEPIAAQPFSESEFQTLRCVRESAALRAPFEINLTGKVMAKLWKFQRISGRFAVECLKGSSLLHSECIPIVTVISQLSSVLRLASRISSKERA